MRAVALAVLLALVTPAATAPRPPPVVEASPYPCFIVRWYLRNYDRATLQSMGREYGITLTPGQIKAALACEKG